MIRKANFRSLDGLIIEFLHFGENTIQKNFSLCSGRKVNEACISAPAISINTDQMKSPLELSKGDSVIEEDKTYAKSMLGTTEESSGAEHKVLGVR